MAPTTRWPDYALAALEDDWGPEPPEDWGWWDSIEEQDAREFAENGEPT